MCALVGSREDPSLRHVCEKCGKAFSSRRRLSGHRIGKHIRKVGMKNATIDVEGLSMVRKGYLAGFLDGEGGIQITKSERPDREYKTALHPTVYFCNTHEGSIRTLRKWLGGGSITRRRESGNRKDTYVLSISGVRNIKVLLTCLLPHMIIKVPQAKVMIRYCERRLSHYRGKERRYTKQELRLYTTLKGLNRKGGGVRTSPRTDL